MQVLTPHRTLGRARALRAGARVQPSDALISLRGVDKVYRTGKLEYQALRSVDLEIAPGEMVAVIGPSGSGKTTIMNMITGIDRPTGGEVIVDGAPIHAMNEEKLAAWRGRTWESCSSSSSFCRR